MNVRYYEIPEERNLRVLDSVVRLYTEQAKPVSSAAVARDLGHIWSSATVRNVFSELEILGWLHQPHQASGRIPSELGFRIFVEQVIRPGAQNRELDKLLEAELDLKASSLPEVLDEALNLVSRLSHALGISLVVLNPEPSQSVRECRMTGVDELLEQPEFSDPESLKGLIHLLQDSDPVGEYMEGQVAYPGQVKVLIGSENSMDLLNSFSLVATRIRRSRETALLGVMGPVRMEYSLVLGAMEGLTRLLSTDGESPKSWS
jgi:transcriptional regulator of heat shock response